MSRSRLILILMLLIALVGGYLLADYYTTLPEDAVASFTGRQSCVECHQQEAALFHGSHHDLAMDVATDESVLANFDNQTLEHHGIVSRMYREDGRFMVETEGPDGQLHPYQVKYVFGVEPLQQYMVEIEPPATDEPGAIGRVQVLRLSWETTKKRWFYLAPPDVAEKLEPNDPLHWTGVTQNWNVSCAECHSTNLQRGFDPSTNRFATTFSEIDVSCEACHGPGSLHVELANQKSLFWDRRHGLGLAKLKSVSNKPQIEACAPCHSRRSIVVEGFKAGCRYDDYFALQMLQTPIYHADGQVRDEDYVYGSFLQSKMYHNGIRCSDCHDPHSARLKHEGNLVCTSCHQHPSGKYDSPSHHFHKTGTEGAQCVNCHMPHTTYMLVDQRRDHSFRVPRPDLSVRLGTPNACTGCHLEPEKLKPNNDRAPLTQYADWLMAAEQGDQDVAAELKRIDGEMLKAVEAWYPGPPQIPEAKYYEQLAVGLTGGETAVDELAQLSQDSRNPAIMRASAMLHLSLISDQSSSNESVDVALSMLGQSDLKVVSAALQTVSARAGALVRQMGDQRLRANAMEQLEAIVERVGPLLRHESGRVRMEAARAALLLPPDVLNTYATPDIRAAFEKGTKEVETSLRINQDRAAGQMMLGGFYEQTGDGERAEQAYRLAIKMEPAMAGPRSNLANLLENKALAIQQTMRGEQILPNQPAGGRVAELRAQAAEYRKEDHQRIGRDLEQMSGLPNTHALHYRFAMSCLLQRDYKLAEQHLDECLQQQPGNETYLYAATTYYYQTGNLSRAAELANRLLKLDGGNPAFRVLADEISSASAREKRK